MNVYTSDNYSDFKRVLFVLLRDKITESGATQIQIAKALRVTQPRVSHIIQGHINEFSLDFLVKSLMTFDCTITVSVAGGE